MARGQLDRSRLHPLQRALRGLDRALGDGLDRLVDRMDGEDIMHDSLFEACCKVDQLEDPRALRGWLFRIAHNRCIDFLRNRNARKRAEANYAEEDIIQPPEPTGFGASRAIERLVIHLPPRERACVLLKDVFDYSLEEIAELVDSTVVGVKSALNRGRTKLASLPAQSFELDPVIAPDPQLSRLLNRYVDQPARLGRCSRAHQCRRKAARIRLL